MYNEKGIHITSIFLHINLANITSFAPFFHPKLNPDRPQSPHPEKGDTQQRRNKPNVQRVIDLLQQLQRESRSSVDLPDLVQQLLKCSGGSCDAEKHPQATFSKCKSFTEGTFPELEIGQQKAIVSQLRVKFQGILI